MLLVSSANNVILRAFVSSGWSLKLIMARRCSKTDLILQQEYIWVTTLAIYRHQALSFLPMTQTDDENYCGRPLIPHFKIFHYLFCVSNLSENLVKSNILPLKLIFFWHKLCIYFI